MSPNYKITLLQIAWVILVPADVHVFVDLFEQVGFRERIFVFKSNNNKKLKDLTTGTLYRGWLGQERGRRNDHRRIQLRSQFTQKN